MNKYPQKWIDAIPDGIQEYYSKGQVTNYSPQEILAKLEAVGALKEPPKPREWHMCPKCFILMSPHNGNKCNHSCDGLGWITMIKVREVLDE